MFQKHKSKSASVAQWLCRAGLISRWGSIPPLATSFLMLIRRVNLFIGQMICLSARDSCEGLAGFSGYSCRMADSIQRSTKEHEAYHSPGARNGTKRRTRPLFLKEAKASAAPEARPTENEIQGRRKPDKRPEVFGAGTGEKEVKPRTHPPCIFRTEEGRRHSLHLQRRTESGTFGDGN